MLQAWGHMAEMPFKQQGCCSRNRACAERKHKHVLVLLTTGNNKPLFDPSDWLPFSLCLQFVPMFQKSIVFLFLLLRQIIRCRVAMNTHLNRKKAVRVRKNTIGVDVTLEPLETKIKSLTPLQITTTCYRANIQRKIILQCNVQIRTRCFSAVKDANFHNTVPVALDITNDVAYCISTVWKRHLDCHLRQSLQICLIEVAWKMISTLFQSATVRNMNKVGP